MDNTIRFSTEEGNHLDDVILAYLQSVEAGAPLDRAELIAAHPDLAKELGEFFANQDRMMALAGELPTPADGRRDAPARIRYFGDYESLEEIARGGMGVVYKARQKSLKRMVAIKMLLGGAIATDRAIRRFRTEAEAIAQLRHPGIVAIYEVGQHDGQPYFSMEHISGASLAQLVRANPVPPYEAADYIRQAADAVHYAHQHGVLHRDIKPSNLLLDTTGRIRVTDFGLAKHTTANEQLTTTGDVLGTPSYMPPEQATGNREEVGPTADVYSLGAVLYELLTGRAPFRAASAVETLRQVQDIDPVAPRALNPVVPRDLETIVGKCLRKRRADRYATAGELADDLERFLAGLPVRARPMSAPAKLVRWCQRRPLVASLAASVLVLLVVISVVSTVAAIRIRGDRDTISTQNEELVVERDRAENAESEERAAKERFREAWFRSNTAHARASRWSNRVGRRFESLSALASAARFRPSLELRNEAITCMTLSDLRPLVEWTGEAKFVRPAGGIDFDASLEHFALDMGEGEVVAFRVADRGEAFRFPKIGTPTDYVRFSDDGSLLAAVYGQGAAAQLRVWDVANRNAVIEARGNYHWDGFDFSPDGRLFAAVDHDRHVDIFDLKTGQRKHRLPAPEDLWLVRFHPRSKQVAASAADGTAVFVWDVESGELERTWSTPADIYSLAWHPDGERMFVGCEDARVYLLAAGSDRAERPLEGHSAVVSKITVSAAGDVMATHGWDGRAILWDLASYQKQLELDGHVIRWNRDGRRLAWHNGSRLGTWQWEGGRESRLLYKPEKIGAPTRRVAFHPTLPLLAASGSDGIRLWNTESETFAGRVDARFTVDLAFHPLDGSLLATIDGAVWRWRLEVEDVVESGLQRVRVGTPHRLPLPTAFRAHGFAVDGRGDRLVAASANGQQAMVFAFADETSHTIRVGPASRFVAISPDGAWAALGAYQQNGVDILDLEKRDHVAHLPTAGSTWVAFTPDGASLVTSNMDGYRWWTVGDWAESAFVAHHEADQQGIVAPAADGHLMAITQNKHAIDLIDPVSRNTIAKLESAVRPLRIFSLAFSGDGTQLAAALGDDGVRVWYLDRCDEHLTKLGLPAPTSLVRQPPRPKPALDVLVSPPSFYYASGNRFFPGNVVASGAEWKFFDRGADLGVAWRELDFDDERWPSGPTPLGYGSSVPTARISYGDNARQKHATTYFRRRFTVNPSADDLLYPDPFVLGVVYDDGIAVYLNGAEVFRDNLDSDAGFASWATDHAQQSPNRVIRYVTVNPALLVSGENVLAAEVHQRGPTSSDLLFDLELSSVGTTDSLPGDDDVN